jgi:sn-glycerol 3-phosphate transport system ATP-binding protein
MTNQNRHVQEPIGRGAKLEIKGLGKSWGSLEVLHDINVDIDAGTFLTLLGPSGCGKSTALRLIAGLDEVSSGAIFIDGKDVTNLPPAERNIGMVFQNYALFPHMSVQQNILYGMKVRKEPANVQKESLGRVADLMGLGPLLDRVPSQLSGGQQQRVALARVLVANRPLVLMDEPLSNLDAKLRVEIRSEIRELNKKLGITIVYVTHDQSEALSMSDKVLLMNGGETSQFGEPSEIYTDPQNTFAASFIGTPPMNLIPASLVSTELMGAHAASQSDLQIGIRAEDFVLSSDPTALGLKGQIVNAEYEGVQTLITIDLGENQSVIATVSKASKYDLGGEVHLGIEPKAMHLFKKSDGQKLPFMSD